MDRAWFQIGPKVTNFSSSHGSICVTDKSTDATSTPTVRLGTLLEKGSDPVTDRGLWGDERTDGPDLGLPCHWSR